MITIISDNATKTHIMTVLLAFSFLMQVKCYGPGLEPTGCIVNKPADFTIDAQGAGRGQLKIYAQVSNFSNFFAQKSTSILYKCALNLQKPFISIQSLLNLFY